MAKTVAFRLSSRVFEGSYQAGIPMVPYIQRYVAVCRITDSKMEVIAQSLHEQLRVELGKFGKFRCVILF